VPFQWLWYSAALALCRFVISARPKRSIGKNLDKAWKLCYNAWAWVVIQLEALGARLLGRFAESCLADAEGIGIGLCCL
jgi:hypothetical protein